MKEIIIGMLEGADERQLRIIYRFMKGIFRK